jgi:citrate lyase subunit beta/citryl-CoA lyase
MAEPHPTPIRSLLFVPGSDDDSLQHAVDHGADAVVIDLEEPRTPFPEGARERTRLAVRTFFQSRRGDRDEPRWFARVQPPSTGQTLKDLRAVMGPQLTGVLLPKIQGPEDVYRADGLLTCMEGELALPLGSTILYPILETAQSIRLAYEIAVASPRIHYLGGAVSRFGDIHQALGFRGLRKDANHFSFGPRYWWTPAPLVSATRSAGCGEGPSTTSPA